jgi:prepilin-type processing-associated H-X9-DG protein
LIELLVVIAMIAILAALLLPALSHARVAANNVVCLNNLRQQELGLQMYADDTGVYPPYIVSLLPTLHSTRPSYWMDAVATYLHCNVPTNNLPGLGTKLRPEPKSVFACPAYTAYRGVYNMRWMIGMELGQAYAYNAISATNRFHLAWGDRIFVLDGGLGANANGPVAESAIASPSRMIAVGDSTPQGGEIVGKTPTGITGSTVAPVFTPNFVVEPDGRVLPRPRPMTYEEFVMEHRHDGKWNMVFCDGHVEHQRPEKFFNYCSDDVLSLWNRDHKPHRR